LTDEVQAPHVMPSTLSVVVVMCAEGSRLSVAIFAGSGADFFFGRAEMPKERRSSSSQRTSVVFCTLRDILLFYARPAFGRFSNHPNPAFQGIVVIVSASDSVLGQHSTATYTTLKQYRKPQR